MSPATALSKVERAADVSSKEASTDCLKPVHALALFALGLASSIFFNFFSPHADCSGACDASEYIRVANGFLALFKAPLALISGSANSAPLAGLAELRQGGPVFPLFIAACLSLISDNVSIGPVIGQCFVLGAAAVVIALTTARVFNRRAGLVAGVITALYPGFIVNTGRLESDFFAATLFSFALWMLVRGFEKSNDRLALFITGFALAALELTRSIMIVFTVAAFILSILQQKERRKRVGDSAALIAGLATVLFSWCALQYDIFGKASLVVDRVGNYNVFIGNNTAAQGWLSFPYPDGRGIEQRSMIDLTVSSLKDSPVRWARLMMDKPLRLFKFPWNDFRASVGPFSFEQQVGWHQLIVMFGLLGIPLAFLGRNGEIPRSKYLSRLVLCGALVFSLVYCLFITVSRYNLSGVTVLIMFAASATTFLWDSKAQHKSKVVLICVGVFALYAACRTGMIPYLMPLFHDVRATLAAECVTRFLLLTLTAAAVLRLISTCTRRGHARAITIVLAALLVPFVCMPLRADGRWYEWRCPFGEPGQVISHTIQVPTEALSSLRSKQSFLIIDADGVCSLAGCRIEVNGVSIDAPIVPGLAALQNFQALRHQSGARVQWEGEYIFDCMTNLVGISNADLRQWLLVPLPSTAVTPKPGVGNNLQVVITRLTSAPGAAVFGNYETHESKQEIPAIASCSWEKAFYGVENDTGLTDPRFDDHIALSKLHHMHDMSSQPGLETGSYSVHLLVSNLPAGDFVQPILHAPLEFTRAGKASLAQFDKLPPCQPSDYWLVRLRGSEQNLRRCSATLTGGEGPQAYSYETPWVPKQGLKSQTGFDCAFPIAPAQFPGELKSLRVRAVTNASGSDNLSAPPPSTWTLDIWRLAAPGTLLQKGYQVF